MLFCSGPICIGANVSNPEPMDKQKTGSNPAGWWSIATLSIRLVVVRN